MIYLRRVLGGGRFWACFVFPQAMFAALAWTTEAATLIPALNVAMVALAVGVCVAFSPSVIRFFSGRGWMDQGDALSIGIFTTWFATALNGGWSLTWRYLGQPAWLANNDFVSYFRYMFVAGAILHLVAPGAIADRIPPAQWVRIGSAVAITVFVAFAVIWALDKAPDLPGLP